MVTAIYARKSTDETSKSDDTRSCARQVQRAREYAARRGWRVDDRYVFQDEAVSGAEFRRRPGLNKLLESLRPKPRFRALVISEPSRLGREQIETAYVLKQIVDEGVRVFAYLDDKEITIGSALEKFVASVQHFAAESEREQASKRVRDKMKQLAEQGRYARDHQRVVKPSEASTIRKIFKRRAEGAGYFKIAQELTRDKVPSPSGAKPWWGSQIGSVLRNETYAGVTVWGRRRRTKRRGTLAIERAAPESMVRMPAPALRIVTDAQWRAAQAVNEAATERTWRSPDGRLKSRPTESKHLLTPFLACGVCGGSMHVQYRKGRKEFLYCTSRHLLGKEKCSNARGLPVETAEKVFMQTFEEALAGAIVLEKLQAVLERHRAALADPEPLRSEAKSLRQQIDRLVNALSLGEIQEVHDKITALKTRLEQVEDMLAGTAAMQEVDVAGFSASLLEVAADWRAHLRKNPSTAQQVLRKILPQRLRVWPSSKPGVAWEFDGMTDYRKVLEEIGFQAVLDALKSQGFVDGAAELTHEVKHPAGECRPEDACWPGSKLSEPPSR